MLSYSNHSLLNSQKPQGRRANDYGRRFEQASIRFEETHYKSNTPTDLDGGGLTGRHPV